MANLDQREPSTDGSSRVITRRIAEVRSALGLTQQETAEALNTSLYALVRWQRGDVAPSADVMVRLENLLRQNPNDPPSDRRQDGVFFPSTGYRQKSTFYPLLDRVEVDLLQRPREDPLGDIYHSSFWADGDIALGEILGRNASAAPTRSTPFLDDISAGKNTYTYDAHTYHTKVPPQGIANVIQAYLPDGGVVLDPFAGSGMTGVAARHIGRDVILNELSPAACFIADNFTRSVNINEFNSAVDQIVRSLRRVRDELYMTTCRECGADTELLYTVWSYSVECNHCGNALVVWQHARKYGRTVREHRLLRKFRCPSCGNEVTKSNLKRLDQVPVLIGYRCCSGGKIREHEPSEDDIRRIKEAEQVLSEYAGEYPTTVLPDGVNLKQPKRHGIKSVADFYSSRNLAACASLWREIRRIRDPELSAAVGFVFTSLYQRVTRCSEYRFWGGSGNMANFNVPHVFNEANVFVTFERKAKTIADHYCATAASYQGRCAIHTGSATDLSFLPDDSVDLIFTDPPFGANINYSEMNIVWESWLGHFTDPELEAIVSRAQDKDVGAYESLMAQSLQEAYRVLRPDHWMVLVFMNSSERIWAAVRNAISTAGFSVEKVAIFDKQHGTFKQFVSANAAGADLMIHCRKQGDAEVEVSAAKGYDEEDIEVRLEQFVIAESTRVPHAPFLHVERAVEVDYRRMYSRYIAREIREGMPIVGFARFRRVAGTVIGDTA